MLETKFTTLRTGDPTAASETGRFSGYASLFETTDDGGDRIARGAFARTLAERRGRVKLLWQHDPTRPIGVWERLIEDQTGLLAEGRLLLETQQGREAAALLVAGALDGMSIGFQTRAAEKIVGGRRLIDIELWEISLVTFPMLSGARAAPDAPPSIAQAASSIAPAPDDSALVGAIAAARSALA